MLPARRTLAIIPRGWALPGAIIIMMDFGLYISNYNDVNVLYKNNGVGLSPNVAAVRGVNDGPAQVLMICLGRLQ